jgi:hypothetical protein
MDLLGMLDYLEVEFDADISQLLDAFILLGRDA